MYKGHCCSNQKKQPPADFIPLSVHVTINITVCTVCQDVYVSVSAHTPAAGRPWSTGECVAAGTPWGRSCGKTQEKQG